MRAFVLIAGLIALWSCASSGAGTAPWCDARPVEFGTRRISAFQLHVTSGGADAAGARVRWRPHALLVSPGGEWQEGTADPNGQLVSKVEPGRFEVEICTADGHALHGYVELAAGAEDHEATLDASRADAH